MEKSTAPYAISFPHYKMHRPLNLPVQEDPAGIDATIANLGGGVERLHFQ